MGNVIPLKVKKGTVREHLLEIAVHQARVQGKSLVPYLKELQAQAERKGKGDASLPSIPRQVSREKYVYLTHREGDLLFVQITDVCDRALFGTIDYFGLRASAVGLWLGADVNFRTRRIYIPRLKGGVRGEKVLTADCRRLLQSYFQSR